jgi:hypothetical protein
MKKFILFLALIGLFGAWPTLALAESPPCTPDLYGKMICPPPNGGMMADMNGNTVCGPGSCARDSRGKVRCSSQPGGQVIIDSSGNVLCVGGCVEGLKSSCMSPTP